jgi:hypothetical protein
MHPTISQAVAEQQIQDARRAASERRRASGFDDVGVAKRRGFSRYFGRAREGHVKSVHRARRGAGSPGARLT